MKKNTSKDKRNEAERIKGYNNLWDRHFTFPRVITTNNKNTT